MKTMLVGIDYTIDGQRYISNILYTDFGDAINLKTYAATWKKKHDEVYTIDLDPNHQDFIQEIVLHGCRM